MVQSIIDSLATYAARIEESAYTEAVILPNFPRSIQLDYYSCGAKSVYTILKYFGKNCTPGSVEHALRTREEGTAVADIKRVLNDRGLFDREFHSARLVDLKKAIDSGRPCLISMYDSWHYAVVYGYSDKHVLVMNPSLSRENMGSIRCAVKKKEFKRIFDGWALEVRMPR